MIICLSSEFGSFDVDELRQYRPAIENLLRAHAYGWHLFVPDRAICDLLMKDGVLGESPRRFLSSAILGRHSVLLGQARSVRRHILAYPAGEPPLELDDRQIHVPLRRFENMDCCAKAELLTENAAHDGELFVHFAELASGSSKAPISLKLLNGGGDTFANELVRDNGSCPPRIGIVDSDRLFPNGPVGQTAAKAIAALGKIKDPAIGLKLTHGRAIENYFPPALVSEIMAEPTALPIVQAQLEVLNEERRNHVSHRESMCLYISWKKGVKFGDVRKTPEPHRATLKFYVQALGGAVDLAADNDETHDAVLVVGRNCGRFIQRTHELTRTAPGRFENVFRDAVRDEIHGEGLIEMSETVLAYGLAPARSAEPV